MGPSSGVSWHLFSAIPQARALPVISHRILSTPFGGGECIIFHSIDEEREIYTV